MSLVGNQNRRVYSFKSVGRSKRAAPTEVNVAKKPIVGIKTPLELSNSDGLFTMHRDVAKQVSDNLRNLILTNHGERLGRYDFGANIMPIVFDLGSEAADQEAVSRISTAVGKFMPFVSLCDFQVFVEKFDDSEALAKVGIQITYKIPRIDTSLRSLEVMLYAGG